MTGLALTRLSLQRVDGRRDPRCLDNEQRLKAYRPYMPTQFANTRFVLLSQGEQYAANEAADNSEPSTDVHYNEWRK